MTVVLVDDHLVRDLVTGEVSPPLTDLSAELGSTNLWLFRLVSAVERAIGGTLSAPVVGLDDDERARFRRSLTEQIATLTVVPFRDLLWPMAELQDRHRAEQRPLSTAMAEALAAARFVGGEIAVAAEDVGPGLQAAAEAEGVPFHVVERS